MGHTYSNILLHVVFSTKDRRPFIREDFRERLHEYMAGIVRHEFGMALKIGGTENHIHGLLSIGTDLSIGQIMSKWKSLSSGWLHRTIVDAADFAWQGGYSVFSVSNRNADAVIRYISQQAEHHRTRTFEEELLHILDRNGIKYDPRTIWE